MNEHVRGEWQCSIQPWAGDFSYTYFTRLLQAVNQRFEFHLLSEAPEVLQTAKTPIVFLRHDIDVSLKRALKMAEIEHRNRVCANYMVMNNSPLYDVRSNESMDIVEKLLTLGHEIGLHIDLGAHDALPGQGPLKQALKEIDSACSQLEQVTSSSVKSVSFHRPQVLLLKGPLVVGGRVNAFAAELMNWYLSDSKGRWREGEPIPQLVRRHEPALQLLIHPIWWDDKHSLAEDRLQNLFDAETRGWPARDVRAFDRALAHVIPGVRRRRLMSTWSSNHVHR